MMYSNPTVVPAKAGTHNLRIFVMEWLSIDESRVVMGPRRRGDDKSDFSNSI
jgi:hypothetical protein